MPRAHTSKWPSNSDLAGWAEQMVDVFSIHSGKDNRKHANKRPEMAQAKAQALTEFKALAKEFLEETEKSETSLHDGKASCCPSPGDPEQNPDGQHLQFMVDTGCFDEILKVAESSRRIRKKSVLRHLAASGILIFHKQLVCGVYLTLSGREISRLMLGRIEGLAWMI